MQNERLKKFIEKAVLVHNGKYNYTHVNYINMHTKVLIQCEKHGLFEQRPHRHLQGDGCKECAKLLMSNKMRLSINSFIDKSNEVHNYKYDYSNVDYVNNKTKVKIKCPIHGVFEQTPSSHLTGTGCKLCGYNKTSVFNTKSTDKFIIQAKKIHGDKYDYSSIDYINTDKKIGINCNKHGEFWQKPSKHLQGQGCPICKESKLEIKIRDFLINNNIKFIPQFGKKDKIDWLGQLSLDFYLPEYNLAIECQGEQHFKPVDFGNNGDEYSYKTFCKNYERDETKYNLCVNNGIDILYFTDKIEFINGGYFNVVYTNLDDLLKKIKNEKKLL